MKTSKIFPGICLTVLFIAGLTPAAQAALVNSPWQPVDLQGNSGTDTSGILSFSKLSQVKSNGTIVPFVLSPNQGHRYHLDSIQRQCRRHFPGHQRRPAGGPVLFNACKNKQRGRRFHGWLRSRV